MPERRGRGSSSAAPRATHCVTGGVRRGLCNSRFAVLLLVAPCTAAARTNGGAWRAGAPRLSKSGDHATRLSGTRM